MPYIGVKLARHPDPELAARLAAEVGRLTHEQLGKDPTVTSVGIEFVDPRYWFIGGRSVAEAGASTYWLDIKVTQGTNTRAQVAAYLAAVHDLMREAISDLSETSYGLVHDVPAANWGFGGRSQEYRFIAGTLERTA